MYNKFTENELIEAYTSMMDYSGKANKEILDEIEKRGGLEKFLIAINDKKINKQESDRVLNEIIRLNKDGYDLESIKENITSEIWTTQHLNDFIENRYIGHQLYLNDKTVDKEVLMSSFLGFIVASFTGSALWAFSIILLKFIFYPTLIVVYIISYLIIRGFTGKSRNNLAVFLACLMATIASLVFGSIIIKELTKSYGL